MQVTEFQVVTSEFLQRLKTTGPGLPNTDLAKGLELLKKFQVLQQSCTRIQYPCNIQRLLVSTYLVTAVPSIGQTSLTTDRQKLPLRQCTWIWLTFSVCLQEEAATISQQREQLVLAEKLFGMDITGYPDLVQVSKTVNIVCAKQRMAPIIAQHVHLQSDFLVSVGTLSICTACKHVAADLCPSRQRLSAVASK